MTKRSESIRAHITPQEKEYLTLLANKANISLSELVRRLITGAKLPDPSRHSAVITIVKANADLARLGNLLKMALDDKRTPNIKINRIVKDINSSQNNLKIILNHIQNPQKI